MDATTPEDQRRRDQLADDLKRIADVRAGLNRLDGSPRPSLLDPVPPEDIARMNREEAERAKADGRPHLRIVRTEEK